MNDRIATAIHDKELANEINTILASDVSELTAEQLDTVRRAEAACNNIRDLCHQASGQICDQLERAGIGYQVDEKELNASQIHQFSISIKDRNPTRAMSIARQLGYRPAATLSGAEWEIFWRSNGDTVLTRTDDVTMRLRLRWPQTHRAAWQAPFWPNLDDAALVPLPASLWRLAFVLRPIAILARRLGTPRRKTSIGEFLGTPVDLVPQLLAFADLETTDVVYDLGCGDGRILVDAARRYGCRAVGYELDTSLCRIASNLASRQGVDHLVEIHNADAMAADLQRANVMILFQPPDTVSRLVPKLLQQLPPGGRIIAHEQSRIRCDPSPSETRPLFSTDALTVAHLWQANPRRDA